MGNKKPLHLESQKSLRDVMPLRVRAYVAKAAKTKFRHDSALLRRFASTSLQSFETQRDNGFTERDRKTTADILESEGPRVGPE